MVTKRRIVGAAVLAGVLLLAAAGLAVAAPDEADTSLAFDAPSAADTIAGGSGTEMASVASGAVAVGEATRETVRQRTRDEACEECDGDGEQSQVRTRERSLDGEACGGQCDATGECVRNGEECSAGAAGCDQAAERTRHMERAESRTGDECSGEGPADCEGTENCGGTPNRSADGNGRQHGRSR